MGFLVLSLGTSQRLVDFYNRALVGFQVPELSLGFLPYAGETKTLRFAGSRQDMKNNSDILGVCVIWQCSGHFLLLQRSGI